MADAVAALCCGRPGQAETLYSLHRSEITARFTSQERELAANLAEQGAPAGPARGAQATLAVLEQRVVAYKTLLEQQYGARCNT